MAAPFDTDQLILQAFMPLTDQRDGRTFDFRITPYTLNTGMSFKFENLAHFVEFLKLHEPEQLDAKAAAVRHTLLELGLDPAGFFFVNFFEPDPENPLS